MQTISATTVKLSASVDYGEGSISFCWPDPLYDWDQLEIDLEGFCSRRMPIHSGQGPPAFVEVQRDRIRLRFSPPLAEKLKLEEEVEIVFSISNADFDQLRAVVEYFS